MLIAALVIGSMQWLWPAIAICALLATLLGWSYLQTIADRRLRIAASTLKGIGILALAICLVEPLWSSTRARPGSNLFALLCDNSQSLIIRDAGRSQHRGEAARTALTDEKAPWQVRLNQDFEVRRYLFDGRMRGTTNYADLNFTGPASALESALLTLRERYASRPLAGVLLFTDGNSTDQPQAALNTAGLPPIYPVVLGAGESSADLAIASTSITQSAFEDAPVTLQAVIASSGYDGRTLVAQLLDEKGEKVAEQTAKVDKQGRDTAIRFQFRPKVAGVSFYRLQVAAEGETAEADDAAQSKEATTANNRRLLAVDRGQGPYRVLYVAGRPNWEFKFLRRAVEQDEQVQLVAQIRIAKREAKFDFRGRAGESSNPLFRGFGEQGEDTQRYDQPVLLRLNIRDDAELRDGFPKSEEALFSYHAVVLDDLEAEFFTPDQMKLLAQFVSERGGGLLMLGGQESFQKGKYHRTPVGDLLPVYLDRSVEEPIASEYRLSLSREGWLQPWVRLRTNEADETRRLSAMPAFRTLNRIGGIKPGASVLATVADPQGNSFPALVAQRYGLGRSAALLVGDAWRWQLRQESGDDDLGKAWRQIIRWLVNDVPQRVSLEAQSDATSPQPAVRLQVRAFDAKYKPLDNAQVQLNVHGPGVNSEPLALIAQPAANEAGWFEATFVPREPGGYKAEVKVTDEAGIEVGKAVTGWVSDPAAEEFKALRPNRQLLEKLAADTKGEVVEIADLDSFVRSLPSRKMPITEPTLFPLWHQPYVFLFALACLIGEWGLRRRRGLA